MPTLSSISKKYSVSKITSLDIRYPFKFVVPFGALDPNVEDPFYLQIKISFYGNGKDSFLRFPMKLFNKTKGSIFIPINKTQKGGIASRMAGPLSFEGTTS
ncbi:MAG: hypothetical protein GY915_05555 [bacterium]|nr:hypothetical protein [bacterium]